jgi:EF hand
LSTASFAIAAPLALPMPSASAQQPVATAAYADEQFAFDAADSDGDGMINEAELARDAARGFATLDKNGDGKLMV